MIQKSPDTKKEVIPDISKARGKRKHKETACIDKRKAYGNCGICGSGQIMAHGVIYCQSCTQEDCFLVLAGERPDSPSGCECDRNKPPWRYPYFYYKSVKECLDCGAVCGPKCPVCRHKMWVKGDKRYCSCGYRI